MCIRDSRRCVRDSERAAPASYVPAAPTKLSDSARGGAGVLRGVAEQTMRMLRANAEALLTILEVLVGNPLYEWARDAAVQQRDPTPVGSHTPAVVEGGGGGGDDDRNAHAELVLLRIQQKLDGRVHGGRERLAIQGQVRQLIDEARDPENLCRMYHGWAAWL